MIVTDTHPVQVDEYYFQGRRKYNRGRYLSFDDTNTRQSSLEIANWGSEQPNPDSEESNPQSKRNYGNRVQGPWVVSICQGSDKVRCFVVQDRKASTLVPLIESVVHPGSVVCSDEWKGYLPLSNAGFTHRTVNHKEYFVDTTTGANNQMIERHWVDLKAWLRRARRPNHLLQSHLDEVSYRKLRS